jgi:hypothetical protein
MLPANQTIIRTAILDEKQHALFVENIQGGFTKTYVGTAVCCGTLPGTNFLGDFM